MLWLGAQEFFKISFVLKIIVVYQMGLPPDTLADKDGNLICDKLPVLKEYIEKLTINTKEV